MKYSYIISLGSAGYSDYLGLGVACGPLVVQFPLMFQWWKFLPQARQLKSDTISYEEKEQQLVSDCVKELRKCIHTHSLAHRTK